MIETGISLVQWKKFIGQIVKLRSKSETGMYRVELNPYIFWQFCSFSEAQWSGELYRTLNKAGGLLHTKAETYDQSLQFR